MLQASASYVIISRPVPMNAKSLALQTQTWLFPL